MVARGLTRRFGDLVAVDQLDLTIPRASVYGFLGPNGSGKTTAIRLLCGLLEPSAGEVTVLGLEMPQMAEKLRRRIGYMTQRFSLFEDLSVRENLEFMGEIYSLPGRARRQRVDELLELYRLTRQAKQRAGTLSGGQRQRLALAAAVLHEPELLFLDEPTSAVDPENRREFWESLFQLSDAGTTILVSTHYMDEAERCHALAILDRGRLMAEGAPRKLMDDIDAVVVEIETPYPRRAREAITTLEGLLSVAQLGTQLRALFSRESQEPLHRVQTAVSSSAPESTASVQLVRANLEDVFVAVTRHSPKARPVETGSG
ncbi:MAG: ABC transporter ATP-binding protein [Thermoanaerobaculia bacterium]|nr:ABC transporter ATP-binding protein [Thermoanaerobaculia bacterium]